MVPFAPAEATRGAIPLVQNRRFARREAPDGPACAQVRPLDVPHRMPVVPGSLALQPVFRVGGKAARRDPGVRRFWTWR